MFAVTAFNQAVANSLTALQGAAGVTVTYRRDDAAIPELVAIPGSTKFKLTDEHGGVITVESKDFLIAAVELVINGQMIDPQRGDTVEEVIGPTRYTYRVMRPDGGDDVWRIDHARQRIRIHTKLISEDAAT